MLQSPDQISLRLDSTLPIGGQLISALRQRIITGKLQPGMRLSEKEIAFEYDLSRQPVREAFIKLAGEKLLEVRPQRGTFVCKIDPQDVEMSRFIREAVEAELVREAALNSEPDLIAKLRQQLSVQQDSIDKSARDFVRLDDIFHQTLAIAAGREGAWEYLQPIKVNMDRVRYLTAFEFPLNRLIYEHGEIVDAVESKDPDRAEAALRKHMAQVLDDLPKIMKMFPHFFVAQNLPDA